MAAKMTLRQKQSLFAKLLGEMIVWIYEQGWEITFSEGYIEPSRKERIHMPGSLHRLRLAMDINLFVDGKYITGEHPAWFKIGHKWESMHELTRWGGNWDKDDNPAEPGESDLNHLSLTHGGKA